MVEEQHQLLCIYGMYKFREAQVPEGVLDVREQRHASEAYIYIALCVITQCLTSQDKPQSTKL